MSFELINTIGTVLTVAIVGATAIAALAQLKHLSAANQVNAMLTIGEEFNAASFVDARRLVRARLPAAQSDPAFREYLAAYNQSLPMPDISAEEIEVHRALLRVGNKYEELGILVKRNIIDTTMFLDRFNVVILDDWRRLAPITFFVRDLTRQPAVWENFEYLAVLAEEWAKRTPTAYPIGVRRMKNTNPWPIAPPSAPSPA